MAVATRVVIRVTILVYSLWTFIVVNILKVAWVVLVYYLGTFIIVNVQN